MGRVKKSPITDARQAACLSSIFICAATQPESRFQPRLPKPGNLDNTTSAATTDAGQGASFRTGGRSGITSPVGACVANIQYLWPTVFVQANDLSV